MLSREILGVVCGDVFGGFVSERFARAGAGLGLGSSLGFCADRFCAARFGAVGRPFAADERFAFLGGVRRDFAAVGFLRFRGVCLPDFGLDLRAMSNDQVCKTWMAGINPAMSAPTYQPRVASASWPKTLKTRGFRSKLYSRASCAA